MSQENTETTEKTPNHTVVSIRVRLRPHRSAIAPAQIDPRNMPTNDSEVT